MVEDTVQRVSEIFGSLSNPVRVKILDLLTTDEFSVNEIARRLQIGQSNVSQHLKLMQQVGMLKVRKEGTTHFYGIRGPRLARILMLMDEFCETHQLYGNTGPSLSPSPTSSANPSS